MSMVSSGIFINMPSSSVVTFIWHPSRDLRQDDTRILRQVQEGGDEIQMTKDISELGKVTIPVVATVQKKIRGRIVRYTGTARHGMARGTSIVRYTWRQTTEATNTFIRNLATIGRGIKAAGNRRSSATSISLSIGAFLGFLGFTIEIAIQRLFTTGSSWSKAEARAFVQVRQVWDDSGAPTQLRKVVPVD